MTPNPPLPKRKCVPNLNKRLQILYLFPPISFLSSLFFQFISLFTHRFKTLFLTRVPNSEKPELGQEYTFPHMLLVTSFALFLVCSLFFSKKVEWKSQSSDTPPCARWMRPSAGKTRGEVQAVRRMRSGCTRGLIERVTLISSVFPGRPQGEWTGEHGLPGTACQLCPAAALWTATREGCLLWPDAATVVGQCWGSGRNKGGGGGLSVIQARTFNF